MVPSLNIGFQQTGFKHALRLYTGVCGISSETIVSCLLYFFKASKISFKRSLSEGPDGAGGAGGVFILL